MRPQQLRDLLQGMDRVLLIKRPHEWRVTMEQFKALMRLYPEGKFKGVPFTKIMEKS